ncbi:MAG TPA: ATP-binding protein [Nevskiaceae bacterium]|nr:ATP-binding protein [Nevskiaceae bacterium]
MHNKPTTANRRILVVDDNQAIHQDFRKIFGGNAEADTALSAAEAALFGEPQAKVAPTVFDIDSAYQGQEALEMVHRARAAGRPYAMAFMDVRMPPGWDGVETTAHVFAADPEIQIVICTAYSDYSWAEMHDKLGHTDRLVILKKPFDNVEVLQLANALTEKWRLARSAAEHVEDLEQRVASRTAELDATNAQLRALLESTSAVPWEMDRDTRACRYIGRQVESRWGWPASRFAEPGFLVSCVHADDREKFDAALARLTNAGEVEVECRFRKSNGGEAYVRSLMSRGVDLPTIVRGVSIDLTAQKKLEEELRQAQKLESVGRLAAGIAHEINTPVQFVNDSCHFLRDGIADLARLVKAYQQIVAAQAKGELGGDAALAQARSAEVAADLEYLAEGLPSAVDRSLDGLQRVATIVRSMKDFAHADNPDLAAADLNRAIQSTLVIARSEYKQVAEVKTDLGELPPVMCHLGELNQAVLNIVVNAAHAIGDANKGTGRVGLITVSTRLDGDQVVIDVADDGPGIPEAIRAKVFEPFFTTKEIGRGTGQGLAIARSVIVAKHHGELNFDTQVGKGTTFHIRLPLDPRQVALAA